MFPESTVLIALMNSPRDLALAREQGWYRIPVKHAPKVFLTDYLAFYLTRAFGEDRWAIHEYAAVRGHELVTRRDLLPDQPDHPRANEQYYKLQLGPLVRLPRPIVSRHGRRLLFLVTTAQKFMEAEEINDLLSQGPTDDRLWITLKEAHIPAERQMVLHDGRALYRVDFAIYCRQGQVGVCLDDNPHLTPVQRLTFNVQQSAVTLLRFTTEQVDETLPECLAVIQAAVQRLGGPA